MHSVARLCPDQVLDYRLRVAGLCVLYKVYYITRNTVKHQNIICEMLRSLLTFFAWNGLPDTVFESGLLGGLKGTVNHWMLS